MCVRRFLVSRRFGVCSLHLKRPACGISSPSGHSRGPRSTFTCPCVPASARAKTMAGSSNIEAGAPMALIVTRPTSLSRTLSTLAGDQMCRAVHDVAERRSLAIVGDGFGGLRYVPVEKGGFGRCPVVMGEQSGRTISLSSLLAQVPEGRRRADLLSAVTDPSPSMALERAGVVNWNPGCTKLVALRTQVDGNCLCHSASLAVWGVHDRHLLLRRAVRSFFVSDDQWNPRDGQKPASTLLLRNYWGAEMCKDATLKKADLDLEWAELQHATSLDCEYNGRVGRSMFRFLEPAHVFALAHVLRRPVLVLATDWMDSSGRKLADKEEIAGIYLPLQLPRNQCCRVPLLLAFHAFHFSPLLPLNDGEPVVKVPLVDSTGKLLPVPFFRRGRSHMLRQAIVKHWMDCEHLESDGTLVVRYTQDEGSEDGVLEAFMASVLETEGSEAVYGRAAGEDGGRAAHSFYAARAWEALPVREVPREQRQEEEEEEGAHTAGRGRQARSVRLEQPRPSPTGEGQAAGHKDKAAAAQQPQAPVLQAPVLQERAPAQHQQQKVAVQREEEEEESVELGEDELLEFAATEAIFGGKHIPDNSHYTAKVEDTSRVAEDRALQADSDLAMTLSLTEAEEGEEEEEEEVKEPQRRRSVRRQVEDTETTGDERSASTDNDDLPYLGVAPVPSAGCVFLPRRRGTTIPKVHKDPTTFTKVQKDPTNFTKEQKDGSRKGGWRGVLEAIKPQGYILAFK